MVQDPLSVFGSLLGVCVSEEDSRDRSGVAEGAVLFLLGVGSSVLTTYILAALGILV
jgi:hypothetical protein